MNHQNSSTDFSDSQFEILLHQYFEGGISEKNADILKDFLYDPRYVKRFVQFSKQEQIVYEIISSDLYQYDNSNPLAESDLLQEFAIYENIAPAISREQLGLGNEKLPIQRVEYPKHNRQIKKGTIVSLIASVAAILLFFLFIRFAPTRSSYEVATLADSIDAKWDINSSMQKGKRLVAGRTSYLLKEGWAELLFDNEAKLTLEAPVEFQIHAEGQIKLSYGRLYATVPQGAIGFTVNTPSARIIDLGTEFGVEADFQGNTSLHVMKGKTVLVAGNTSDKTSMEVSKGIAKKVSAHNQTISDISYNGQNFVREIDSASQLIWRGRTKIDLADILGGGNGFGTGREGVGIDPASGELVTELSMMAKVQEDYQYFEVAENPYIDGVFVPLGNDTPHVVTSKGDIFKECPKTDGRCFIEITNKAITGFQGDSDSIRPARLNGVEYGSKTHPAIMMHANSGITFDLKAIRAIIPDSRISQFTSSWGLSETLINTSLQDEASVDMWVLVDGQPRERIQVDFSNKSFGFVTVNINDNDRFLTLISCSDWNAGDWALYGDPVLELELND